MKRINHGVKKTHNCFSKKLCRCISQIATSY